MKQNLGKKIHELLKILFPIHRSLAGPKNKKKLRILKKINKNLIIKGIKSGKKVFDWKVPNEWIVKDAYIITPSGKKICNVKDNNLHLMSYSVNTNKLLSRNKLNKKIYSIPSRPNAIPYVTSYYKKNWGFCMKHKDRLSLKNGKYKVYINSKFKKGYMNYGEINYSGRLKKTIVFSSYICHPSMANNELSGPCINTYLSKYIGNLRNRKFSYKFLFLPETIGSISYIYNNLNLLKKNTFAGFNLSCLGDEKNYSMIFSRNGNTASDRVTMQIIKKISKYPKFYSWLDRGSDERQYCSPGVDLPFTTISRTKFGCYKEYHNSDDNFTKVVTPSGLLGGYNFAKKIVDYLEKSYFPYLIKPCEPFLTNKKLYPSISNLNQKKIIKDMMNVISYSDGNHCEKSISQKCFISLSKTKKILKILKNKNVITW